MKLVLLRYGENIAAGFSFMYEFDAQANFMRKEYLGNAELIPEKMQAVSAQGGAKK